MQNRNRMENIFYDGEKKMKTKRKRIGMLAFIVMIAVLMIVTMQTPEQLQILRIINARHMQQFLHYCRR